MNSILGTLHDWLFEASIADWELRLVWAAAVPQTLFVLIYMWTPWLRSWVGRAVFTKATGLCLLLDNALVTYLFGPYPYQEQVTLAIVGWVASGSTLQLFALLHEMWRPTSRDGFVARRSQLGTSDDRLENQP